MRRLAYDDLLSWKESEDRMPLMINGVRQCGKTYLMKRFGSDQYRNVAYFNFEESPELGSIFASSLEPHGLLRSLSIAGDVDIRPSDTLIVFDEIQACRRAITSLKYFSEEAPEYHVMCAGSLPGVHLGGARGNDGPEPSFPVGRIDILDMHPMDFEEFLLANGREAIRDALLDMKRGEDVPEYIAVAAEALLREYMVVGGMPAAVKKWVDTHSYPRVKAVQRRILDTYASDLRNHPVDGRGTLELVWGSVPEQLAKDTGRFIFGHAVTGARAKDLDAAVMWLVRAGMAIRVDGVDAPAVPLSGNATGAYKLYMADVGLFSLMSGVPPTFINSEPGAYKDFKGAMAESVVLQNLVTRNRGPIFYWRSGAKAEVDFVVPMHYENIPVEVRAGSGRRSKSLGVYMDAYGPRAGLKISMDREVGGSGIVRLPLYMAWCAWRYVRPALEAEGWADPEEAFDAGREAS